MGKVISLNARRGRRSSATSTRDSRSSVVRIGCEGFKALGGIGKRSGVALSRTIFLMCLAIFIAVLAVLARPLRLFAQLGAVAVLIAALFEFLDHWRHMHLLFVALGALAFVAVLLACYEHLLAKTISLHSKMRGF